MSLISLLIRTTCIGTPEVGSTMGEYSVFNLPQRNSDVNGHILLITVTPTVHPSPEQVFTRTFRTGTVIFYGKVI